MTSFDLSNQPKYPIVTIDFDNVLQKNQIINLFNSLSEVTLCVRSSSGHQNRGGYFFCIKKLNNDTYQLETIEGVYVDSFDIDMLTKFINHSSGRKFSSSLLDYCQNSINFRND